jgi:hypothetical protein
MYAFEQPTGTLKSSRLYVGETQTPHSIRHRSRVMALGSLSVRVMLAIPSARETLRKKANENLPLLTLLISVWADSTGPPSDWACNAMAKSLKLTLLRTISVRTIRQASSASGSSSLPVTRLDEAVSWAGDRFIRCLCEIRHDS